MFELVPLRPDYKQYVILRDGRQVVIRPVYYTDKDAMLAFFNRLSLETRFLRFHYAKATMTEKELDMQCVIDYYDNFVLVAEMDRGGCTEIVGVARYDRLLDFISAEAAFVVEDKEQRKGIGTCLLKFLAAAARGRGIAAFVAETNLTNAVMLAVFRKYDPACKQVVDGDCCCVTFTV